MLRKIWGTTISSLAKGAAPRFGVLPPSTGSPTLPRVVDEDGAAAKLVRIAAPAAPAEEDDAVGEDDDAWTRSPHGDNWFEAGGEDDQPKEETLLAGDAKSHILSHPAFAALPSASSAPTSGPARKRVKFNVKNKAPSAVPGGAAGTTPRAPAALASRIGLFREQQLQHEHVKPSSPTFARARPKSGTASRRATSRPSSVPLV
jgi:hypothetical protein